MKRKQQIRNKFRNEVFERDDYTCRWCNTDYFDKDFPENYLDAHHITDRNDMPNGGYVKENGISLCKTPEDDNCHLKAEKFHISGGEEWEEGMHPDDLYKIIDSSKELAIRKSERL